MFDRIIEPIKNGYKKIEDFVVGLFNNVFQLDKALNSVISIDEDLQTIHFFFKQPKTKNSITHKIEKYSAGCFDDKFYDSLKKFVKLHATEFGKNGKVAIVLPDLIFLTDSFRVPFSNKTAMQTSLSLAFNAVYNNASELKTSSFMLSSNKQTAHFNVHGIRKEILYRLSSVLSECSLSIAGVTSASNASINCALAMNAKLRNANFIVLDVKENYSRFSIAVQGKTSGYYPLPFGFSSLSDSVIKSEPTLFDHTAGDLLVLNAREKAKKKQLTTLEDDEDEGQEVNTDQTPQQDQPVTDDFDDEDLSTDTQDSVDTPIKTGALYKRINQKLPKFMQRPTPESPEGFVYENFRHFVKWALEVISSNSDLFNGSLPETVYVNMPENYNYLFDMVNEESLENKCVFAPLFNRKDKEKEHALISIELYGGFFIKKYNKSNVF